MTYDNSRRRPGFLHDVSSRLARLEVLVSDLKSSVENLTKGNEAFHDRCDARLRETERRQDQDMGEAQHKQRLRSMIGLLISITAAASGWVAYFGHPHDK